MMAAKAYYRISAKDETKAGIKSALNGLKGLKSGASSALSGLTAAAGGVAAAFAAIGVAGAGFSSLKESVTAFQTAEAASIRLAQAVRNSPLIDAAGFQRIEGYADQLERLTALDGDMLKDQANLVVAMGLNEDQTKATLQAATELAASGVMPLDAAVKALGITYSGNLGTLGRQIPALKNLTTEQLKNGEAVRVVAQQYAGMASQVAKTTGGIYAGFQIALGNLQEEIGKPLAEIGVKLIQAIQPTVEKLTAFMSENSYKIVNFFTNLPQIALKALSIIPRIIETVFSFDYIEAFFKGLIGYYTSLLPNLVKSWLTLALNGWQALFGFIAGATAGIWVPISRSFEDVGALLKMGFSIIINFFIEKINFVLGEIKKATENPLFKKAMEFLGIKGGTFEYKLKPIDTQALYDEEKKRKDKQVPVKDQIETERKKAYEFAETKLGDMLDGVGGIFDGLKDTFGPTLGVLGDAIEPIVGEIKDLIETNKGNTSESAGSIANGPKPEASAAKGKESIFGQIINGLDLQKIGEAFSIGFGSKGITGMLSAALPALQGAIAPLLSAVGALAGPFMLLVPVAMGLVEMLMPALQGIIKPLMDSLMFLGKIVGAVLLPIFDALAPTFALIGQMLITLIAPVLELLAPFMEIIAGILNLVLTPTLKMVAVAFEILMSPVKFLADLFIWSAGAIKTGIDSFISIIENPLNKAKWKNGTVSAFQSDAFTGLLGRAQAIQDGFQSSNYAGQAFGGWENFQEWSGGFNPSGGYEYAPAGGIGANYTQARDITVNVTVQGKITLIQDIALYGDIDCYISSLGANYTQARDITVNVTVQGNILDQRDFALMIRSELREAEALGL